MGGKKTFLSSRSRITLIQSIWSRIPSYFSSLFKISALIASRIGQLQRDFYGLVLARVKEIILLVGI